MNGSEDEEMWKEKGPKRNDGPAKIVKRSSSETEDEGRDRASLLPSEHGNMPSAPSRKN